MFQVADYKLTDLLSTAGATVGIIIAAGILLGNLGAQYVAIVERFRGLASEYRGNNFSDPRRENLQTELSSYRRQILLLNWATMFVALAVVLFLISVATAGLSIVYPEVMAFRTIGTVGLLAGLLLIAVGVALQFVETFVQRQAIHKEVADFSDLPPASEAIRR